LTSLDFFKENPQESTGNREFTHQRERFPEKTPEVNGLVLIALDGVKGSTNYLRKPWITLISSLIILKVK